MEQWLAGLDAQLEAARTGAATVPQQFLHMAGLVQSVFHVADGKLPIFLEFWTKAGHDPAIWQATIAPYRKYRAFIARMVEAGITEGTLRRIDAEKAAQIIVSLAVGVLLQGLLDPHGADWGQVAKDGVRMLLEGLERK